MEGSGQRSFMQLASAGLLYALVLALLHWPLLTGQRSLFAGDISQHYLPWEHQVSRTLALGAVPHLHPGFYCGHPLLAEGQAAVYYPPTRISAAWAGRGVLAGDIHAFNLDVLFHWWWLALGVCYAALVLGLPFRSALLAGAWCLTAGLLLVLPVNMPILRVAAWTGWLLAAATTVLRDGSLLAALGMTLCWTLVFLAGGPQMAALVVLALALFVASSAMDFATNPAPLKSLGMLAAAPVIGGLLAAVQLLPTWLFYQESAIRSFAGEEAAQFGATWYHLATWLVPPMWLTRLPDAHPLPAYFPGALWFGTIGAAAALFGLISPRAPWRLKIWLSLLLVLALGSLTPIYPMLTSVLPFLGWFRAPDRFLIIALVPLILIAAWGFEHLLQDYEEGYPAHPPSWQRPLIAAGAILTVAIAIGFWAVRQDSATGFAEGWWQVLRALGPLLLLQAASLALGALVLLLWERGKATATLALVGALVLPLAELLVLRPAIPPLRTLPTAFLATPPPAAQAILDEIGRNPTAHWGRLVVVQPVAQAASLFGGMDAIDPVTGQLTTDYLSWHHGAGDTEDQQRRLGQLHPNSGTLWGLEYIGGIASLYTERMDQYLRQMEMAQLPPMIRHGSRPGGLTLLDLAGGRYLSVPQPVPATLMPSVRLADGQVVSVNSRARPLAWLMQPVAILPETPDNLAAVVELRHDPARMLVLDSVTAPVQGRPSTGALPVVRWQWSDPNTLLLETEPQEPVWLIVTLQSLPGWSATVNRRPVPLHRAWGTFHALPLEAGPQRIELRYETPGWRAGAQISLLTLLVLILAGLWWSPAGEALRMKLAERSEETALAERD